MANPFYKVTVNGTKIIDISDTTAETSDVTSGKLFYLRDGSKGTGTVSTSKCLIVETFADLPTDSPDGTIAIIEG